MGVARASPLVTALDCFHRGCAAGPDLARLFFCAISGLSPRPGCSRSHFRLPQDYPARKSGPYASPSRREEKGGDLADPFYPGAGNKQLVAR